MSDDRPTAFALDEIKAEQFEKGYKAASLIPDRLAQMFRRQRELIARLEGIERTNGMYVSSESDRGELNDRYVQGHLHTLYGFLVRELSEAMQELKSKPWKRVYEPTDVPAFYEEMIDAFHFFLEMCIVAGIDADTLFNGYFDKAAVNTQRQENGY